jgi:hypothetical protein
MGPKFPKAYISSTAPLPIRAEQPMSARHRFWKSDRQIGLRGATKRIPRNGPVRVKGRHGRHRQYPRRASSASGGSSVRRRRYAGLYPRTLIDPRQILRMVERHATHSYCSSRRRRTQSRGRALRYEGRQPRDSRSVKPLLPGEGYVRKVGRTKIG